MKRKRQEPKTTGAGSSSSKKGRSRGIAPRTSDQFSSMSERAQDQWIHLTNAISLMRAKGISLPKASREHGLDPRTVVRLGKAGLKKRANGRYSARPTDNLLRVLLMPTGDGLREVAVRDSRQATLLAEYWVAVHKYLETGDASALRKIRRKTITDADGKRVRLTKDLAELERLGSAGVLSFESLYARAA